jgi:taurine dioxygenase
MCIRMGSSHLMGDTIGTVHNAVADYMPQEPRTMRRAQVMAIRDYPGLVA